MPEPTDHRALAEHWLEIAEEDDFVDVPDMDDVIASALIGIGHALLAGPADAKIAAALKVVEDLDGDPEWAKRQICNALLYGRITDGAPDSA